MGPSTLLPDPVIHTGPSTLLPPARPHEPQHPPPPRPSTRAPAPSSPESVHTSPGTLLVWTRVLTRLTSGGWLLPPQCCVQDRGTSLHLSLWVHVTEAWQAPDTAICTHQLVRTFWKHTLVEDGEMEKATGRQLSLKAASNGGTMRWRAGGLGSALVPVAEGCVALGRPRPSLGSASSRKKPGWRPAVYTPGVYTRRLCQLLLGKGGGGGGHTHTFQALLGVG
ncbi:hypothetical protein P7K49_032891 [Saguinus oedipus]|uniref:Uncharacterized protein n=1 Tax=Saguinus oedipus TaxID=9490 RepID=A0ABQ9TQC7_SAGOE|nr:hypothetical protein P7K49_032891 [Saguinus oedipus]